MKISGDYNKLSYKISKNESGKKLSDIIRNDMKISRRLLKALKDANCVQLNGNSVKVSKIGYEGDIIELIMKETSNIPAEKGEINILYEDIDLLVIDKEAGILVHPTKNQENCTLLNKLMYYAKENKTPFKAHLVNRLDRDTSGLLIVAKNPYAHYELMKQMTNKTLKKHYIALVKGGFDNDFGIINYSISDKNENGIERLVSDEGKECETKYEVIDDNGQIALIKLELLTGRTHQIRVHMNAIGHPLLGDSLYNKEDDFRIIMSRQALHSYSLNFKSPRGSISEIKSNIPNDFLGILKAHHIDYSGLV